MSKKKFYIFGLFILLFLGSLTFIILQALPENKAFKKKAAESPSVATLVVSGPATAQIGNALPVQIYYLQTLATSTNGGITGIKAILSYTFTGTNPLSLNSDDIVGNLPPPWNYAVKTVTVANNTVVIDVEAAYIQSGENGYLGTPISIPFATLNFRVLGQDVVTMRFMENDSQIIAKAQNLNILGSNLLTYTLTIGNDENIPVLTLTPSLTPSPASSPTPSSTPIPQPPNPYCSVRGFYPQGPYSDIGSAATDSLLTTWTQFVNFTPNSSGAINGARVKVNVWYPGTISCKITNSTGTTDSTQEAIRPMVGPTPPIANPQWADLSFPPFSVIAGVTYRLYCRNSNSGDFRWIYNASTNVKTYSICMQETSSSSTPTPTLIPTVTTSPTISLTPIATVPPTVCPLKSRGDADCNGEIKLADFFIWRREFLQSIIQIYPPQTIFHSDFNSDGKVDLKDFFIWRREFLRGI